MLPRFVILGLCCCVLGSCLAVELEQTEPVELVEAPPVMIEPVIVERTGTTLEAWWSLFNDPVLDRLVSSAVSLNMPRQKAPNTLLNDDISYSALRRFYRDQKAVLIADVAQSYMHYRYVQNQQQTLDAYISDRNKIITTFIRSNGDTKDPHFIRVKSESDSLAKKSLSIDHQKEKISRDITKLTKLLPEYVSQVLKQQVSIPRSDITPVLVSSASMIAISPDVIAARFYFTQKMNNAVAFSDTGDIFPDTALNGFYGISDDVYVKNNARWSVSVGHAVKSMDLQRFETLYSGQDIYNDFRNHLFGAVMNIERLIVSYAHIQEQYIVLRNAAVSTEHRYAVLASLRDRAVSAQMALLDARADAYDAEMAALHAEHEKAKLLIEVYEKLGVY
ncbi:MAG: hypothetical protein COB36_03530 [Alphaproteobacteria bacterium]|nr:MAG: hypothetical protein COB36_03530 [Alphaproteobacteria bacterium]